MVEAVLGGFRKHAGQLSENLDAYLAEMRQITRKATLIDGLLARWDRLLWNAPVPIKKRFNADQLFRYDHATRAWA